MTPRHQLQAVDAAVPVPQALEDPASRGASHRAVAQGRQPPGKALPKLPYSHLRFFLKLVLKFFIAKSNKIRGERSAPTRGSQKGYEHYLGYGN